ncbi:hypothetical protein FGB62_32g151 [Gracilaria domingensis]|nr:hypothetical protein FGB62_32g151 [Gracilaria domingensis]
MLPRRARASNALHAGSMTRRAWRRRRRLERAARLLPSLLPLCFRCCRSLPLTRRGAGVRGQRAGERAGARAAGEVAPEPPEKRPDHAGEVLATGVRRLFLVRIQQGAGQAGRRKVGAGGPEGALHRREEAVGGAAQGE